MDTAKKPEEIKLSKSGRIRFTAGFFVCAILWMTGLAIVSAVLLPQHLRDIAGEAASTTIFGYVNAATAIASLVANLLFGNLSDRVPDDMRATMSAFNSAGTTVGSSLGTLIGAKFITIQIPGFATAGILMGLAGIATIVVWPQEQSSKDLHQSRAALRNSWPHSVLQCTTRVTFGWPSPDGRC
jgi:MFS family permease